MTLFQWMRWYVRNFGIWIVTVGGSWYHFKAVSKAKRYKNKKQPSLKPRLFLMIGFFFHHGWFWSNRIIPGTDFPSVGERFNQFVVFYRKVMDISMVDTRKKKQPQRFTTPWWKKNHTKEIAFFFPAATSVLAHQVWCFHPNWRHWVWVFSTMKALKIFHGLNWRIWPLDVPSWRQVWFLAWQTGTVGTCGNTAVFFFFFFVFIIIIIIIIILGVVAKMSLYTMY